jgi:hypothetical protein
VIVQIRYSPRIKALLLLLGHMVARFGFMLGARSLLIVFTIEQANNAVGVFVLFQLVTGIAIVVMASPAQRMLLALGIFVAVLWTLFCSFLASMAVTGNWM